MIRISKASSGEDVTCLLSFFSCRGHGARRGFVTIFLCELRDLCANHPTMIRISEKLLIQNNAQAASATTSFTSGINCFNKFSIPFLRVIADDGQPLHEPFNISVTIPSSKDLK